MAPVLVVINLAVFVQMIQEVTVFVMMRIIMNIFFIQMLMAMAI
jgi:hypothetical protein